MYIIDAIDKKIVNLLVDDGRKTCAEIARLIGDISERSVRYRLERMLDEGLIQINAIAKPKALGYAIIADVWMEVEADSILQVANKMAAFAQVSYVACAIGETDISVQLVGRDTNEIYRFVTEVIGKIPGVRKTTTAIVPLVLKDIYQWKIPE
jgi:Lrp/AsnC family transcriptional regulator for asnA, asnC and gidA